MWPPSFLPDFRDSRYRAPVSVHSCEAKTPRKVRKKGIKLTRGCRKHVVRGSELILYARAINASSARPKSRMTIHGPRWKRSPTANSFLCRTPPLESGEIATALVVFRKGVSPFLHRVGESEFLWTLWKIILLINCISWFDWYFHVFQYNRFGNLSKIVDWKYRRWLQRYFSSSSVGILWGNKIPLLQKTTRFPF